MKTLFRRMNSLDLDMVLDWRNHPEVMKMSGNKEIITIDDHKEWFFKRDGHRFVFEIDDEPIGVVTLKPLAAQSFEWSFYLNLSSKPSRGTGKLMLSLALFYFRRQFTAMGLKGRVKNWNEASLKLHKDLGFSLSETNEDETEFWKVI